MPCRRGSTLEFRFSSLWWQLTQVTPYTAVGARKAVTWLLLPFAVFGTKAILRKVLRKNEEMLQELKELRLDQQDILYELRRLRNAQLLPNEQQALRDPSNRDGLRPGHPRP